MFGTLMATSMVEYSGDGGVAGINMPVDATGPSKASDYWLTVGTAPGGGGAKTECIEQCKSLLPVGGAGSAAAAGGPGKTANAGGGSASVEEGGVGWAGGTSIVGGLIFGAGVAAWVGGAPAVVIIGLTVGGIAIIALGAAGAFGGGDQKETVDQLKNALDGANVSIQRYLMCVNECIAMSGSPVPTGEPDLPPIAAWSVG